MVDLATWNLSIPEGSPPKTIETPRLVDGFQDKYFNSEGSTVYFWAPVTGTKTENAIYPRTELRETYKDGTLRNWLYPEADNFLNATLTVNQVPSSGKVVIGQIHTKDSNKPMVKLEYQYKDTNNLGDIVAKVRMRPDDSTARIITVASGVKLSQAFSYRIHLDRTGDLGITAAGRSWYTTISSTWRVKPLYFKAGAYVQDNTGYTSEGGKVTFSRLDIDHNT